MAKTITTEEIERAKQYAEQRGIHQNWETCSFRKSGKGNIVCSCNDRDIFLYHPSGIIKQIDIPSPDVTGTLGKLTKKQRKRLLEQQREEDRKQMEQVLQQQVKQVLGATTFPENSWADSVKVDSYAVIENTQPVATLAVTPILKDHENSRIGHYKSPILFRFTNWNQDVLKSDILSVYQGKHTEGEFVLTQTTKEHVFHIMVPYLQSIKGMAVSPDIIEYLTKNGLYKFIARLNDPDTQNHILFNVSKFTVCKDGCVHFSFCDATFVYDFKQNKITVSNLKTWQETAAFVKKHKTALLKCIQSAKAQGISAKVDKQVLKLSAVFQDDSTHELLITEDGDTPLTAAAIKRWHKSITTEISKKIQEQEAATIKKIERLPVYGDMLAFHILEFIKNNEGYITEAAAIKNLRGLSQTFSGTISDTEGSGKYALLTTEEISDMIQKLINFELLQRRRYDGTYGVFYTLKTCKDSQTFLRSMSRPYQKVKKQPFSSFTDLDWVYYFKKIKESGKERKLTKKELQEQMQLLEHKNVVLLYPEETKEFLKNKPTEWRLYADTMYTMENGIPKKYWKLVKSLFPTQKS